MPASDILLVYNGLEHFSLSTLNSLMCSKLSIWFDRMRVLCSQFACQFIHFFYYHSIIILNESKEFYRYLHARFLSFEMPSGQCNPLNLPLCIFFKNSTPICCFLPFYSRVFLILDFNQSITWLYRAHFVLSSFQKKVI